MIVPMMTLESVASVYDIPMHQLLACATIMDLQPADVLVMPVDREPPPVRQNLYTQGAVLAILARAVRMGIVDVERYDTFLTWLNWSSLTRAD